MLLKKVRVDAQAHDWVTAVLAADAMEAPGMADPGAGTRFARDILNQAIGEAAGPGAPSARRGLSGDETTSGS